MARWNALLFTVRRPPEYCSQDVLLAWTRGAPPASHIRSGAESLTMKLVTVVGARPQFVKAAVLDRAIRSRAGEYPHLEHVLVHTGQHYDDRMSEVFFQELDIPAARHNLGVGGGQHGEMTGRMLIALEPVLMEEDPQCVVVVGDTNSTLAAALVASKLNLPLAHVEAGLRSFNRRMPEEINRIVADQLSDVLFAPTDAAMENLTIEGIVPPRAVRSGDVMLDSVAYYRKRLPETGDVLRRWGLAGKSFALMTLHRQENTDDGHRLREILAGVRLVAESINIVWPMHPRTRSRLEAAGLSPHEYEGVQVIEPIGYLDLLSLLEASTMVLTDSGGLQKEAYMCETPCVTLREETEWVELLDTGMNSLCAADRHAMKKAVDVSAAVPVADLDLYGDGRAGERIVATLIERFDER